MTALAGLADDLADPPVEPVDSCLPETVSPLVVLVGGHGEGSHAPERVRAPGRAVAGEELVAGVVPRVCDGVVVPVLTRAVLLAVALARALPDALALDQFVVGGQMADPLVESGAVDDADRGGDGVQGKPVELAPQVESAGSLGRDGLVGRVNAPPFQ